MVPGAKRIATSAALVIGAFLAVTVVTRPSNSTGPCDVVQRATVDDLPEASGLALSRQNAGILWAHNDSGNSPVLFAIDASGVVHGRVRLPVALRDWEDLAAAQCAAGGCLYIGDIGDNGLVRRDIRIYRVPEPQPGDLQTAAPETFVGAYPDGAHNAEALFVVGSDAFIITKDRTGLIYRTPMPPRDARLNNLGGGTASSGRQPDRTSELKLERIGQLGLVAVTDAEASPDENVIAVRTSDEVVFYQTADLVRGRTVPRQRIAVNRLGEPQGEGVAFDGKDMVYLASEGGPWHRAGRLISLRCDLFR